MIENNPTNVSSAFEMLLVFPWCPTAWRLSPQTSIAMLNEE